MMYKGFITLALYLCTSCSGAYQKPQTNTAPVESSTNGFITYGKENLQTIKSTGKVTLNGTDVSGPVDIRGSLTSLGATLGPLNVNGNVYLEATRVSGPTHIVGFFSGDKSNFTGDITVKAHRITLRDSTCGSIVMQNVIWPFNSQVVELVGNTTCNGNITFESGKGRVILRDSSTLRGKVMGGALEQDIEVQRK